jgi:hypothetical protein
LLSIWPVSYKKSTVEKLIEKVIIEKIKGLKKPLNILLEENTRKKNNKEAIKP